MRQDVSTNVDILQLYFGCASKLDNNAVEQRGKSHFLEITMAEIFKPTKKQGECDKDGPFEKKVINFYHMDYMEGYTRGQDQLFQKGGEENELIQHWSSSRSNHMVHQQFTIIVKFSLS